MKKQAFTLIELLLALSLTIIVVGALLTAYIAALQFGPRLQASRDAYEANQDIKQRITQILQGAYVPDGATDASAFFTTNPQGQTGAGSTNAGQSSTNSATSNTASSTIGTSGSPQLTWTSLGQRLPGSALNNTDDFQTANQNRGPVGGMTEYSLSLNPVGTPTNNQKGVFLRTQAPADFDDSQGGNEELLIPDIDNIIFEFWDGTQWYQSWDTTVQGTKRLPSAVRITYSKGTDAPVVFVVQLLHSNVTVANPDADGA